MHPRAPVRGKNRRYRAIGEKAAAENCDIVLYGHTHLAKIEYREGRYFLNHGSLRQPMEGHPSYIELNLDDKNVVPILVEL